MAFGSVSVTTAITSIMSSFDKPYPASAGALLCNQPVMAFSEFLLKTQSPEPVTRSKLSHRLRSQPPCAQNERSCFRPRQPPSIRRRVLLHLPCRRSPSARWRSPSPCEASCHGPVGQNSAPGDLRACEHRCRGLQNPAQQKNHQPRLHLALRLQHRQGLPPAVLPQFPHAATLPSPPAAAPHPDRSRPPEP